LKIKTRYKIKELYMSIYRVYMGGILNAIVSLSAKIINVFILKIKYLYFIIQNVVMFKSYVS
jgi:hypothetical protein